MKTRNLLFPIGILAVSVLSPLHASPTATQRANTAYIDALAYESAGNVIKARQAYEQALKFNPRHHQAQFRLGQLKLNTQKIISKAQQRKISSIVIPEYRMNEADFPDAVKALAKHIENATKAQEQPVMPNFIIQDPRGTLAARKITIQMKSVPAGEILNYILQMANAKARFDQHAVVIMPR